MSNGLFIKYGDGKGETAPPSKKEVTRAIEILCVKYRAHNNINYTIPFSHEQIKEIVSGVRHLIYKSEGLYPIPKE